MGRRKTYDRDEITDRAMRLFWERGYHNTSTRDLTDAMDVNPYSLYAEFGSKEALFDAALELYDERVVGRNFGPLETEAAGLAQVVAVLSFFAEVSHSDTAHLGCLRCNTSTELAPSPESSRASTARFVARLTAAFANALGNARARGELAQDAPIDALAASLTAHQLGASVLMRAGVDSALTRAATDQVLARLRAFAV